MIAYFSLNVLRKQYCMRMLLNIVFSSILYKSVVNEKCAGCKPTHFLLLLLLRFLPTIEHPLHAKLICAAAEIIAPEHFLEFHTHFTSGR